MAYILDHYLMCVLDIQFRQDRGFVHPSLISLYWDGSDLSSLRVLNKYLLLGNLNTSWEVKPIITLISEKSFRCMTTYYIHMQTHLYDK